MDAKKKVLLVEDNKHTRFIVNAMLIAEGYEVIQAEHGREAADKLEDQNFAKELSVIFLDILMPELNGLELLTRIRSQASLASVPVIMLTTKDMAEDFLRGYSNGADYYISKPFTREQLLYGLNLVLNGDPSDRINL